MELFERILAKNVGAEMSKEETEAVSGGQIDHCTATNGWWTGVGVYDGGPVTCDYD
jgi:hypothetical protein